MQKLLVYADFDWLKEPTLVGELSYESLRGTDSYGFCFNEEWLRTQGGLFLSEDLNNSRAYNIQQEVVTFLDASRMHCPIDGGEHYLIAESRF